MMTEIVTAVYENGLLRPLSPLKLHEHQTVRLQLLPDKSIDEEEEAIRYLIATGILTPPPGHSDVQPLSEEERLKLAETLGKSPGKPLSEVIIEERGEG
jgi:predicted DNA-binding antitoxin AbrB/MazE fold protein